MVGFYASGRELANLSIWKLLFAYITKLRFSIEVNDKEAIICCSFRMVMHAQCACWRFKRFLSDISIAISRVQCLIITFFFFPKTLHNSIMTLKRNGLIS